MRHLRPDTSVTSLLGFLSLVVVTCAPGVALLMTGPNTTDENGEAISLPSADAVMRLDDEAMASLRGWVDEGNPLRVHAIRLNSFVDLRVFRTSPNPRVVLGKEDWLFLNSSLGVPCLSDERIRHVRRAVDAAAEVVEATGRTFRFVMAPDKGSVMDDRLGPARERAGCLLENAQQIAMHLDGDPPDGWVPTLTPLRELRTQGMDELYFHADSHWTDHGAAFGTLEVLASLHERYRFWGIAPDGGEAINPDLARMVGLDAREHAPKVRFEGWSSRVEVLERDRVWQRSRAISAEGEVWPGRTVLLHDSFGDALRGVLPQLFEDLTTVRTASGLDLAAREALRDADTVLVEVAQRQMYRKLVNESDFAAELAGGLVDDLPHTQLQTRDSEVDLADQSGRYLLLEGVQLLGDSHGRTLALSRSAGGVADNASLQARVVEGRAVFDLNAWTREVDLVTISTPEGEDVRVENAVIIEVPVQP